MKKKLFILALLLICFSITFTVVSEKDGLSVDDYISLGNNMGVNGNHIEAEKAFKNALKIDPYYIPAYLGLGSAYGNAGRIVDAIEVFKEGIKLNPSHKSVPQLQMSIALLAFHKMNDNVTAVKYAKKALQRFTDQGDFFGVALAGQKLKQFVPGA